MEQSLLMCYCLFSSAYKLVQTHDELPALNCPLRFVLPPQQCQPQVQNDSKRVMACLTKYTTLRFTGYLYKYVMITVSLHGLLFSLSLYFIFFSSFSFRSVITVSFKIITMISLNVSFSCLPISYSSSSPSSSSSSSSSFLTYWLLIPLLLRLWLRLRFIYLYSAIKTDTFYSLLPLIIDIIIANSP